MLSCELTDLVCIGVIEERKLNSLSLHFQFKFVDLKSLVDAIM